MALKTVWVGEENGASKWPQHFIMILRPLIFYNDIVNYLKILGPDSINWLDREYRLGKAYRCFADNFMREINYHNINEISKYFILKYRVVTSQKVSSKPYNVWSVVVKDVVTDFAGGTKKTGYCTCRAGSGGFFNHITAFSIQVESFLLHVKKNLPKLVKSVSGMYHQVRKLILHH